MRLIFICFQLLITVALIGQQFQSSDDLIERINSDYYGNRQVTVQAFFEAHRSALELGQFSDMQLVQSSSSGNIDHYRFQQIHQGIPVIGHQILLHCQDGEVLHTNGIYTPNLPEIDRPTATEDDVTLMLLRYIQQDSVVKDAQNVKVDQFLPIWVDPFFPNYSGQIVAAYQMDITTYEPFSKRRLYIDANRGHIVLSYDLIHTNAVEGQVSTRYYGVQTIVSDSIAPDKFILRDLTRGKGIYVVDHNGNEFKSKSKSWSLHNENGDELALDLMYCMSNMYDFLEHQFQWSGIDGDGLAMMGGIHNNVAGQVNAYWDGQAVYFGDGNCRYGPLTTHEVVGHELMHGVVQFTSGLVYSGESGAINESLADMTGKSLEYVYDAARFSWTLGNSFILDPAAPPLRRLDDPLSMGHPACYGGQYWIDGNDVHINSSIGNLWFYYLSSGGKGVNEQGVAYDVKSIGVLNAIQIAFSANRDFNLPGTNYKEFATNTKKSAIELFGYNSEEVAAVEEAWRAVGVVPSNDQIIKDLSIVNLYQSYNLCGYDAVFPFEVKIKNNGIEPYSPSMGAKLKINSWSFSQIVVDIDQPIPPGETIVMHFPNSIYIAADNIYEPVTFMIDWDDEINTNNQGYLYITNNTPAVNDINLSTYTLDNDICQGTENIVYVNFTNFSCVPIAAGQEIQLFVYDGDQKFIMMEHFTIEEELLLFRGFTKKIAIPSDATESNILHISALLQDDPNLFNNESYLQLNKRKPIKTDYHEDFYNYQIRDLDIDIKSSYPSPHLMYQNKSWYGLSGTNPDYGITNYCLTPQRKFTAQPHTVMTACIDFSDVQKSTMEFDAIVFINATARQINDPHTAMIRVTYSGSDVDTILLSGFTHGQSGHYAFDLPAYFTGIVKIEFVADQGAIAILENSYTDYDVILFTDLGFKKNELSTKSDGILSHRLYPNPSTGLVYLVGVRSDRSVDYEIINSIGQIVLKGKWAGQSIDMSTLISGQYWVRLRSAVSTHSVMPVTKL